jgi:hypothetical protein
MNLLQEQADLTMRHEWAEGVRGSKATRPNYSFDTRDVHCLATDLNFGRILKFFISVSQLSSLECKKQCM